MPFKPNVLLMFCWFNREFPMVSTTVPTILKIHSVAYITYIPTIRSSSLVKSQCFMLHIHDSTILRLSILIFCWLNCVKPSFSHRFPRFSFDFPLLFLRFSHGFPVFPMGFPMVFPMVPALCGASAALPPSLPASAGRDGSGPARDAPGWPRRRRFPSRE